MEEFLKIFGGKFNEPGYVKAYLKLVNHGLIFLEFRDEVYLFIHRKF